MLWWWKRGLRSRRRDTRVAAIERIAAIGNEGAVRLLIGVLQDPDSAVRSAAAAALGRIRNPLAIEPLTRLLDDPSVRRSAAWGLGELGWKGQSEEDRFLLAYARDDWRALLTQGEAAAKYLLAKWNTTSDRDAIRRLLRQLAETDWPAVEPFCESALAAGEPREIVLEVAMQTWRLPPETATAAKELLERALGGEAAVAILQEACAAEVNGHPREGCRCARCGATFDKHASFPEWHDWNGCICRTCGAVDGTHPAWHDWNGCTCRTCGRRRDGHHDWNGCICRICRLKRDEGHEWDGCVCPACDARRDAEHLWNGCRCVRCSLVQHDWTIEYEGRRTDYHVKRCTKCGASEQEWTDY